MLIQHNHYLTLIQQSLNLRQTVTKQQTTNQASYMHWVYYNITMTYYIYQLMEWYTGTILEQEMLLHCAMILYVLILTKPVLFLV